jgi:tetratricopeptide (TPR) repeat protein
MPEEVRRFIGDLDAKAAQEPDNVAAWLRLAQVKARASQIDPSYGEGALAAFLHVLEREPQNADALQGAANAYYDRGEAKDAIRYYERYLALRPDDDGSRTDLGTMYLRGGDETRAIATYKEVLRRNPSFLQAHYNLAITYHRQGDDRAALAELEAARKLAPDERVRRQIDEMVAAINGQPAPADGSSRAGGDRTPPAAGPPAAPAGTPPGTPFQKAVDAALRAHPILGPRIVRVEWSTAGSGRVLVRDFPMEAMPPVAREKFKERLVETLRGARANQGVDGPVRLEVVDLATGRVMETVAL